MSAQRSGGYVACTKERFPVVFVLVEAKPVEISDPAVVGDSRGDFRGSSVQEAAKISKVSIIKIANTHPQSTNAGRSGHTL